MIKYAFIYNRESEIVKSLYICLLSSTLFFYGCAEYSVPKRDLSDARLALAKVDTKQMRRYNKNELKKIKLKFKKLDELISKKRYLDAKYLAREIEADARLLEVEAKLKEQKHRYKLHRMSDIEKMVDNNISKRESL